MIRVALFAALVSSAAALNPGILKKSDVTGLCGQTNSESGYYALPNSTKEYFYWYFESKADPQNDPTILWMTGGPGCSSELAVFVENGPCKINEALMTEENPFSWNARANLVYIDQPAGTGFSKAGSPGDFDHDEAQVSEDMFNFLQDFFGDRPQLLANEFYIFGESYGGHYVPVTAARVHQGNKVGEGLKLPLKGLAVGNGLTDPEIQYKSYPEMAKGNVTKEVHAAMELVNPLCIASIKHCQKDHLFCATALELCNLGEISPYVATGLNVYDVRIPCEVPGLCYNFTTLSAFLNQQSVLDRLGVGLDRKWESCNNQVTTNFLNDYMRDYQQVVPPMLEDGIKVLIYAGDCDFICNWIGNKAWVRALDWSGKSGFDAAEDVDWQGDGEVREYGGLAFMRIYQAGHMVPMDQPKAALDMVLTFTGFMGAGGAQKKSGGKLVRKFGLVAAAA